MTTIFQPDLLAGKVALITGGGTGIGFGIAVEMARCGADVVIASRNVEHLDRAASDLTSMGARVHAVEANVRDPESVQRMIGEASERFGGLDILVNNAAGNFYAPSESLSPNGWRAVVETDLYGTFFGCQKAFPAFVERGGGRIISISMTLHYRGWPMMAHATAAKAGVDALTRTLALEWATHNITVNAIAPGPILTDGVRKAFTLPTGSQGDDLDVDERFATYAPLGRVGEPVDIGRMAAFLSSEAGRWITGAIFVVDGGSSLAKT